MLFAERKLGVRHWAVNGRAGFYMLRAETVKFTDEDSSTASHALLDDFWPTCMSCYLALCRLNM